MNKQFGINRDDKEKVNGDNFKNSPGFKKINKYGSPDRNEYLEPQNSQSKMIPKNLVYHVKHTIDMK